LLDKIILFVNSHQWLAAGVLLWRAVWHRTSNGFLHVIRITIRKVKNSTTVIIDGQVAEADLKEIRRVRKSIKGAVVLNLLGLDGCESGGIRFLQSWLDAGAQLQDATPFMRMLLTKQPT
jgi:hypothetical protein